MIGNPCLERYLQFGAALVLIAQRATDLRVLNSGDDRSALEHARTTLTVGLVGLVGNWLLQGSPSIKIPESPNLTLDSLGKHSR